MILEWQSLFVGCLGVPYVVARNVQATQLEMSSLQYEADQKVSHKTEAENRIICAKFCAIFQRMLRRPVTLRVPPFWVFG